MNLKISWIIAGTVVILMATVFANAFQLVLERRSREMKILADGPCVSAEQLPSGYHGWYGTNDACDNRQSASPSVASSTTTSTSP